MWKNYFQIALRNLRKQRAFSVVNIMGLSLGMAASLVILNYLNFEKSYDTFHVNAERIYRVPMEITEKGGATQTFAFTYPPVATSMMKDFPEIETAVRWRGQGGPIKVGEQVYLEPGLLFFVDRSVFDIFSFPFAKGNASVALKELNDVVLTESIAQKYFGGGEALGRTIRYREEDYVVKAVLKDLPENSHIRFGILFNFDKYIQLVESQGGRIRDNWGWSDYYTYVMLKPGADVNTLRAKMPSFAERYKGEDMKATSYTMQFLLQPLKEIHLKSHYDYELQGNGNFKYLGFLAIAGFLILVIAWINYVNLATARALDRSKEIGIRKVVGAIRQQLIRQFLVEALLVNMVAIVLGLFIFQLSLPYFSELVGKKIPGLGLQNWGFWATLAGIFVAGSLLAGFYPAFVMSGFRPIQTLKSAALTETGKIGNNLLRKILVVGQFSAAIILVAVIMGLFQQMRYMQNLDLGVNIEQTLVVEETMPRDSLGLLKVKSYLQELERYPDILNTSASTDIPGKEVGNSTTFWRKNTRNEKRCRTLGVDEHFLDNYGLKIIAGRQFRENFASDAAQQNIILNETAARIIGFETPEAAIGQKVTYSEGDLTVVGVLKDYHQESLRNDYDPIVFYATSNFWQYYSMKVNTSNMQQTLAKVESTWKSYFPGNPFQYVFLDEFYDQQYKVDRQFNAILWCFTLLAIVVACLGLLGLSAFILTKRAKEISIRKVLGANIGQIVSLVTSEYFRLILIAGVVALPLAYVLMQQWLKSYVFRIQVGWWFFVLPILGVVLIAGLTVGWQSVRAAMANPVKSMRNE
ncbi:MAG: ABC transporter permease [Haliscomenobacter sp.]|uniref:ABC transporter permease n=1 Tax=Haliscomenobacter sp. TaxID=2717303 RepID=UPI0029A0AC59|nr:ABC transporter permease [Haliscomenobacter sp.]MDX2067988.1 ABC transporter permease [Haliscomenobacter sp.]